MSTEDPRVSAGTASGESWRSRWYPLAFARDGTGDPVRVSVHDHGFALFRAGDGWACLLDRCPHRAARLSDGSVSSGRLECGYHAWQFDRDGRCRHIPQLLASQAIPARAHVPAYPLREVQGLLWMYPSSVGEPDPAAIPTVPALDAPGCTSIDFAIDLPYGQSFLIENVIDIAHIHVAHQGIRGGGHRELAAPIDFEISESDATGFVAGFRSMGLEGRASSLRGARVRFTAPNLVHYESLYEDPELFSGLALYSLPLGRDRCRLLYRAYSNFWTLRDRLRPRWWEHRTQCTILEQDMDVVVGQVAEIHGSGRPPRELWLPLKTSDALVIAYRKWLDRYGVAGTYRVGFSGVATDRSPEQRGSAEAYDRFHGHTTQCASCSRAQRRLAAARVPLSLAVVVFLALAAVSAGSPASPFLAGLALVAAAGRGLTDRLEAGFH